MLSNVWLFIGWFFSFKIKFIFSEMRNLLFQLNLYFIFIRQQYGSWRYCNNNFRHYSMSVIDNSALCCLKSLQSLESWGFVQFCFSYWIQSGVQLVLCTFCNNFYSFYFVSAVNINNLKNCVIRIYKLILLINILINLPFWFINLNIKI